MLAQFYPPIVGGEEHAVRALSVQLVRRGHEVAVASILHDELPAFEEDEGVRVHRLRSASSRLPLLYAGDRHHAPPLPDPELLHGLWAVLRAERPDVVHAHNWMVHSFLPLKPASGVPLVLSLHDYSLICANKRLMRNGVACEGPALGKCLRCTGRYYGPLKGAVTTMAVFATRGPEESRVNLFLPVSNAVAARTMLDRRGLPFRVIPNFVSERLDEMSDTGRTLAYRRTASCSTWATFRSRRASTFSFAPSRNFETARRWL